MNLLSRYRTREATESLARQVVRQRKLTQDMVERACDRSYLDVSKFSEADWKHFWNRFRKAEAKYLRKQKDRHERSQAQKQSIQEGYRYL